MSLFAISQASVSSLDDLVWAIPLVLLLSAGAALLVVLVVWRALKDRKTSQKPLPGEAVVPAPVDLTEAEKKAQEWWKANPNKRRFTVSGACLLSASRGGIEGTEQREVEVFDSAVVILKEGKLLAKFHAVGKISWFEYRTSDGRNLEASVTCPAGLTVEIQADGQVSVKESAGEGASFEAVNCVAVTVHRENLRLVCQGVGKVYASCLNAAAANCRDVSFSGHTHGVAVNCNQVGTHDNAVVYAENCNKVIIMGFSRVKTVKCPDVVHSDRENTVWEKE